VAHQRREEERAHVKAEGLRPAGHVGHELEDRQQDEDGLPQPRAFGADQGPRVERQDEGQQV
jgi:hypothetical protein